MTPSFSDQAVENKFDTYAKEDRERLMRLRSWLFEEAEKLENCGEVVETLKWGEPAYLTKKPNSGSTIRMNTVKNSPGSVALYFNCNSSLLKEFRQHYENELVLHGDRMVEFPQDQPMSEKTVRHCLALALTYHQRKRS